MSRVELSKINSLTLYKDELTTARRTSPLAQLNCIGKPCRFFQPEVVRCINTGGEGAEIDWKCEADLPEALRFGKVEVSCEGYSRPGDPYILKGSCALEYRLVQVPDALRHGGTDSPEFEPERTYDAATVVFWVVWMSILGFILYSFLHSCFGDDRRQANARQPPGAGPGGGYNRGWWPGDNDNHGNYPPPPPYSKNPQAPVGVLGEGGWRPGFWTGAAMGGLANHLFNRNRQQDQAEPLGRAGRYDWEQRFNPFNRPAQPAYQRSRNRHFDNNDRGEGSSSGLGAMRGSTGLGGTNVR